MQRLTGACNDRRNESDDIYRKENKKQEEINIVERNQKHQKGHVSIGK
jgi:hypothetical protein